MFTAGHLIQCFVYEGYRCQAAEIEDDLMAKSGLNTQDLKRGAMTLDLVDGMLRFRRIRSELL